MYIVIVITGSCHGLLWNLKEYTHYYTVFDIEFPNDVEHGVIQIWNFSSYVKISFSCFLLYLIEMKPKRQCLMGKKKDEGSQIGRVH
jgi:hypothetical protein